MIHTFWYIFFSFHLIFWYLFFRFFVCYDTQLSAQSDQSGSSKYHVPACLHLQTNFKYSMAKPIEIILVNKSVLWYQNTHFWKSWINYWQKNALFSRVCIFSSPLPLNYWEKVYFFQTLYTSYLFFSPRRIQNYKNIHTKFKYEKAARTKLFLPRQNVFCPGQIQFCPSRRMGHKCPKMTKIWWTWFFWNYVLKNHPFCKSS